LAFASRLGAAVDLAITAAVSGLGVIYLFEDSLRPEFKAGTLTPVLEPWWRKFSGPFPSRRLMPALPHAFVDFIKKLPDRGPV
jgi:DNA-binding transcriptional LysR family regulator